MLHKTVMTYTSKWGANSIPVNSAEERQSEGRFNQVQISSSIDFWYDSLLLSSFRSHYY